MVENEKREVINGLVAKVLDNKKIVINKGRDSGVKIGDRFKVIEFSDEEIKDPDTNEVLEKLQIYKGVAKVIQTQPKICILESDKRNIGGFLSAAEIFSTSYRNPELLPFDIQPKVKDKVFLIVD